MLCKNRPQYHIISILKQIPIKVNAVAASAAFFMLGDGDSDPELMYVPQMSKEGLADILNIEFNSDQ